MLRGKKCIFITYLCPYTWRVKKNNKEDILSSFLLSVLNYTLQLIGKQDKVLCLYKTQHLQLENSSHQRATAISQPDNGNSKQVLQLKKLKAQTVIQAHLHNWAMKTSTTGMQTFVFLAPRVKLLAQCIANFSFLRVKALTSWNLLSLLVKTACACHIFNIPGYHRNVFIFWILFVFYLVV